MQGMSGNSIVRQTSDVLVIFASQFSLLRAPGTERPFRIGFCAYCAFPGAAVIKNFSISKPGHTTGGSGRGARRGGGARSGKTRCQQNCSPRTQGSTVLSKAPQTNRLNVSPEARTSEILCTPMEEQSPLLTTDSSAVFPRFIRGLSAGREALFLPVADQCTVDDLSL